MSMKLILATGFVVLAGQALAQADMADPATLTCADYMAMDEAGMTSAMEAMTTAATEANAGTAMEPMTEEQTAAMTAACEGDDSMLAMDAMKGAMGM